MIPIIYLTTEILNAFWFMLPAFAGNIAPIFFKWLPFLNYPVDANLAVAGKRLFGDHKTWRGIVVGVTVGTLVAYVQGRPAPHGAILALGNFAGDLLGAYIKRRRAIPSGGKSLFIDAIPSPACSILFAFAGGFLTMSVRQSFIIILSIIPIHLTANRLWYVLKLKSAPW